MFQRILVPLDGSKRAEQVLPVAVHVAKASEGSLLLMRAVNAPAEFGTYATGMGAAVFLHEAREKERIQATAYLADLAHTLKGEHIEVRIAVSVGQAASSILEVAREQEIDLIVLCSHGYTGFKRWALGSVAELVSRQSPLPVLLVREQNLSLRGKLAHPLRATVALDGSPRAEAALLPTVELLTALSAPEQGDLHLVRLVGVPTVEEEFGYLLQEKFTFRQTALREAGLYLQAVRERLLREAPTVKVSWSVEECASVAESLAQIAEAGSGISANTSVLTTGASQVSDLIALTTHGRSGFRRWVAGSVTEHVLHESTLPVFIAHFSDVTQELPTESHQRPMATLAKESAAQ